MIWIVVALGLLAVGIAAVWLLSDDGSPVERDDQLDIDTLRETLDRAGIERSSTRIPDVEILQPYISKQDDFLGAVQARRGNKRSILVALDDRMVAGEATLGKMGAEVITISWNEVDDFEQSFDIGGELQIVVDGDVYTFSHIPRSQTRDFAEIAQDELELEEADD